MNTDEVGKKAALLSAIEIGLGSVLHGFNVPMAGHLLSLNQGFILTRAQVELQDKRAAGLISTTAALLKSISPAGKKLTPMVAIAMQGQLFGLGCLIMGNNMLGYSLGMGLLSVWGFLQPLFFYALVFGETLWGMGDFYLQQLQYIWPNLKLQDLTRIVMGVVMLKIGMGFFLVVIANRMSAAKLHAYETWAQKNVRDRTPSTLPPWQAALKDLWNVPFILTMGLTILYWFYATSAQAPTVWVMLRPIAIAYLIFLLLRLLPLGKLTTRIEKRHPLLARSLASALGYLKRG